VTVARDVRTWLGAADEVALVALDEPALEVGDRFKTDAEYVELYWLPTVGPTSLWLLRRLVSWRALMPTTVAVDDVGAYLGVGVTATRRALARLLSFHLIGCDLPSRQLGVWPTVPSLHPSLIARLPAELVRLHRADPNEGAPHAISGRH
jgi:hypothetical protein